MAQVHTASSEHGNFAASQSYVIPFTDTDAILQVEMWDPVTQLFTIMAGASMPRNNHSIALLLPDACIFNGGGGLCGDGCRCAAPLVMGLAINRNPTFAPRASPRL